MSRWIIAKESYLMHYGIPGQKWGVRNLIDDNGRLTQAGRQRYKGDYDFEYDGKVANSKGYSQDSSLSKQKEYINSLKTKIKALGKDDKYERDKVKEVLKKAQKTYSEASKADRAHYQESKKAAKNELRQEEQNLKQIHSYITGNNKMIKSINNKNFYEDILGKYNKRSDADIEKRKAKNTKIIEGFNSENERVRNMDIREATSEENMKKFRKYKKG